VKKFLRYGLLGLVASGLIACAQDHKLADRAALAEPPQVSTQALSAGKTAADVISAVDLPAGSTVNWGTSDALGFDVFTTPVSGFPTKNNSFLVMSTGCTSAVTDPNSSGSTTCTLGGLNTSAGRDMVQLQFSIPVPPGSKSWLMDWKFFSEEYPEFVGTSFNDAFLVEQGVSNFTISEPTITAPNNVAFDSTGALITINTTGALGMTPANAAGTTYDGSTTSLTTQASVPTGTTVLSITLTVADLGDSVLDSTAFVDNIRFSGNEVGEPFTEPFVNHAPTATITGPLVGNEGAAIALQGTASDEDVDPLTTTWSYAPVSGVDAGTTCVISNAANLNTTFTCNDDGVYSLMLTVNDGIDTTTATTTVTVGNVAPNLTITGPTTGSLYIVGTTVALTSTLTDAGAHDTQTCTVDWDNGAGAVVSPCNALNHVYPAAGVYVIVVTAQDDDGGIDTDSVMVVVYDPSTGFVTGGGRIVSAAGSYRDDPGLTGNANFGFVAKYQKGATTPTGNTEFQFQAGNFNFHSEAYDWLVVSGAKAQFRGNGFVNNTLPVTFTVTVVDGSPDRFRIRVWDSAGLFYDNQRGALDTSDGQTTSSGNIVIHN
jgi:hypothetical protein